MGHKMDLCAAAPTLRAGARSVELPDAMLLAVALKAGPTAAAALSPVPPGVGEFLRCQPSSLGSVQPAAGGECVCVCACMKSAAGWKRHTFNYQEKFI